MEIPAFGAAILAPTIFPVKQDRRGGLMVHILLIMAKNNRGAGNDAGLCRCVFFEI